MTCTRIIWKSFSSRSRRKEMPEYSEKLILVEISEGLAGKLLRNCSCSRTKEAFEKAVLGAIPSSPEPEGALHSLLRDQWIKGYNAGYKDNRDFPNVPPPRISEGPKAPEDV